MSMCDVIANNNILFVQKVTHTPLAIHFVFYIHQVVILVVPAGYQ